MIILTLIFVSCLVVGCIIEYITLRSIPKPTVYFDPYPICDHFDIFPTDSKRLLCAWYDEVNYHKEWRRFYI